MAGPRRPGAVWSDSSLIAACLRGKDQAWDALVARYKNFVYAIILRYPISIENAPDVFQLVWLDVLKGLPKLRKRKAIRAWLTSVTLHTCFHWQQRERRANRQIAVEGGQGEGTALEPVDNPNWLEELEREQIVRQCILRLSPRCAELVRLLFFEDPPRPYKEVAEQLGLATGSIGFIRERCLKRLQALLAAEGLN